MILAGFGLFPLRPRLPGVLLAGVILLGLLDLPANAQSNPLAVVKSASGQGMEWKPDGSSKPIAPFSNIALGDRLETKEKAMATLRLFSAQGQFILHGSTGLKLETRKVKKKSLPALVLQQGGLELNFSEEAGKKYLLDTKNTLVESLGARWYAQFDNKFITKLVVLKGTLKVYNRPKDMSAQVPEGKTCYSDKDGLRISSSTREDLSLFRQNMLEVDFMDPVSEQVKSLEIEYESNF